MRCLIHIRISQLLCFRSFSDILPALSRAHIASSDAVLSELWGECAAVIRSISKIESLSGVIDDIVTILFGLTLSL